MHFDFEDRYTDYEPVGGKIRRWDAVLLSVVVHAALVIAAFLLPTLPMFARIVEAEAIAVPDTPPPEPPRFVFVNPRVDRETPRALERAEDSDKNRVASAERPLAAPTNVLPSAGGDSVERVEAAPEERARGKGPEPSVTPPVPEIVERLPPIPAREDGKIPTPAERPSPPGGGSLGDALKNLQKYVDQESFNNPKGQTQNLGPLQFDTKGVEFGPWIRRFIAQVRRNWFVPMAAMSLRGHVVLTFNVHRNGALTDVQIVQPSGVESFNAAARNALLASNPTQPLPPEYPDDKAFFTVTFYYNESPAGQR